MSLLKIDNFDYLKIGTECKNGMSNDTERNKSIKNMKSTSDTERNEKRDYRLGTITVQGSSE